MRTVIKNIIFIFTVATLSTFFTACKDGKIDKVKYGNCTDDIQNQNEEGIDCGGVCMPCMSCNDGIKNGNETGIDCGGSCQSCSPSCSVATGKMEYTVTLPQVSNPVQESVTMNYSHFSTISWELDIDFTGGLVTSMTIEFMDGFNPYDFIQVNETMVFATVDYGSYIDTRSKIKITYTDNGGYFGFSGTIKKGQLFYMTKNAQGRLEIKTCDAMGDNNGRFSMNITAIK